MYYDSFYKKKTTGIGRAMNIRLNRKIAGRILDTIKQKTKIKICEVGFGHGLLHDSLSSLAANDTLEYFAIEPNHMLANAAREKGVTVQETKIPPFPQSCDWKDFDCAVLSHVVEHFPNYETTLTVFEQIRDALKPDGSIVIFFPDYIDYKDDYFTVDYSHEFIVTSRRMISLLEDAGFAITFRQSLRACFSKPNTMLLYPFHLLIKFFANVLWNITGKDLFFKMKITFARNILMIAEKR